MLRVSCLPFSARPTVRDADCVRTETNRVEYQFDMSWNNTRIRCYIDKTNYYSEGVIRLLPCKSTVFTGALKLFLSSPLKETELSLLIGNMRVSEFKLRKINLLEHQSVLTGQNGIIDHCLTINRSLLVEM